MNFKTILTQRLGDCMPSPAGQQMRRGFVYLAAVIDWFTRKVLAWRVSITPETAFCIAAAEEAMARQPDDRALLAQREIPGDLPACPHKRARSPCWHREIHKIPQPKEVTFTVNKQLLERFA